MGSISTHVLDISRGMPASGVAVILSTRTTAGAWQDLARATTDSDGRVRELLPAATSSHHGVYRLTFDLDGYFGALGVEAFYPEAVVVFTIRDADASYHVPLLLSPFGYSTYRGT